MNVANPVGDLAASTAYECMQLIRFRCHKYKPELALLGFVSRTTNALCCNTTVAMPKLFGVMYFF